MKKKVSIVSTIVLAIATLGFILPKANIIKTASAVTITCTGDASKVCAKAANGTWIVYGDNSIIRPDVISSEGVKTRCFIISISKILKKHLIVPCY